MGDIEPDVPAKCYAIKLSHNAEPPDTPEPVIPAAHVYTADIADMIPLWQNEDLVDALEYDVPDPPEHDDLPELSEQHIPRHINHDSRDLRDIADSLRIIVDQNRRMLIAMGTVIERLGTIESRLTRTRDSVKKTPEKTYGSSESEPMNQTATEPQRAQPRSGMLDKSSGQAPSVSIAGFFEEPTDSFAEPPRYT